MERDNPITRFAQTNHRNIRHVFGIKKADRRHHMYMIGKTGTGKTTLLEALIKNDMLNGSGLAVLDPHGDFLGRLLSQIPDSRKDDIVYLNVPDPNCLWGFNPIRSVPVKLRPLAASGIIDAFRKIWATTWGPRLEHILRNALLTLLDQPNASLADIPKLFYDDIYRRQAIARVTNKEVQKFWRHEYETFTTHFKLEALSPLRNKVGAFLADPVVHGVLAGEKNNIDLRRIMDEGKILCVNLAKGKIGSDNSALLGALLVSQLGMAALSRADIPEDKRNDFYLYLDEFQNFATLSMATMLSELRKYRLNLIIAHQYMSQLEPEVRDAVLGNVGTLISFRIGLKDAELMAREFYPTFSEVDLINLANFNIYLKLMIDGKSDKAFSAEVLPPADIDAEMIEEPK